MKARGSSEARRGAGSFPLPGAGRGRVAPSRQKFAEALKDAVAGPAASLDELLEAVEQDARALARGPTPERLDRYRQSVRRFVQEALKRTYSVVTNPGTELTGRRRRLLYVVRRIDEHLEALTRDVLQGEAGRLALLARLDEIRGMLLDLYR